MEATPRSAAALAAWMSAAFAGAAVRRLDVPEPDLVVVTVHVDRRDHVLVLSAGDAAAGIGVVEKRPVGAPAGAFAGLLRKHLEGARVVEIEARSESVIGIVLRRADATAELVIEVARRSSVVLLVDSTSRVLGAAPPTVAQARALVPGTHYVVPAGARAVEWPSSLEELALAGRSLLEARRVRRDEGHEASLQRALARERTRLERRVAAIESDLTKTEAASSLRDDATAILAALGEIPARATSVELPDPTTGEPRRIALDPSLAPAAHANKLFARARKLDRGRGIATSRREEAIGSIQRIDEALEALARGDLASAERLVRPASAGRAAAKTEVGQREPFRRYRSRDGAEILVGRSAADNDRLTFTHARPHDLWLHARGRTGSHVVLRVDPARKPSESAIEDAALLAAHFSASRGDTAADVHCVERRVLRKPKGGARGSVLAEGGSTVRVRLDADRIAQLLASLVG